MELSRTIFPRPCFSNQLPVLAGVASISQQGCDITTRGRAAPCQAKARAVFMDQIAAVFMVPTSYIGHSLGLLW